MRSVVFSVLVVLLLVVPCRAQSGATTAGPAWQSFEEAIAAARQSGKKVLVDVYAPWCGWCRKMQREVYTDTAILAALQESFEVTRLNVDDAQSSLRFKNFELTPQALGRAFGASGTPTTVFLDAQGEYITRLPGFVEVDTFQQIIDYIGSDAYRTQSFEEYTGETN